MHVSNVRACFYDGSSECCDIIFSYQTTETQAVKAYIMERLVAGASEIAQTELA
jgi:hypothetical protein